MSSRTRGKLLEAVEDLMCTQRQRILAVVATLMAGLDPRSG